MLPKPMPIANRYNTGSRKPLATTAIFDCFVASRPRAKTARILPEYNDGNMRDGFGTSRGFIGLTSGRKPSGKPPACNSQGSHIGDMDAAEPQRFGHAVGGYPAKLAGMP